jgi:hypothetical protein
VSTGTSLRHLLERFARTSAGWSPDRRSNSVNRVYRQNTVVVSSNGLPGSVETAHATQVAPIKQDGQYR